jgi:hypothetical protein
MTEEEFRATHFKNRFPWCDTCKQPAVFNETHGMRHSTIDHPFGVPKHLDSSEHEVTMKEWWDN